MNSLSWILYLADIFDKLAIYLGVISCLLGCFGSIVFLIFLCDQEFYHLRKYVYFVPLSLFIGLSAMFIPSKETMYAIAISETGEEILNSDIGNKATAALEAWLDKQLKETPQENEEIN